MTVPLSAISFCADGHTIGVGTHQGGRVIIYDLKDAKKIKNELKGHDKNRKITSLQFSRAYKSASSSKAAPVTSSNSASQGISRTSGKPQTSAQTSRPTSISGQKLQAPPVPVTNQHHHGNKLPPSKKEGSPPPSRNQGQTITLATEQNTNSSQ